MTGRLLLLTGGCAALWVVLAVPARHFGGGDDALFYSGTAALLCGVAMLVSTAGTLWLRRKDPRLMALAVLGATGVRMIAVLGSALALAEAVPFYRGQAFWLWLAVFYLGTLALDVSVLLATRQPS
jgi:hypothetical protein